MGTNPTDALVARLYVQRRRARHHRVLVIELAEEGHLTEALNELRMYAELEDEIDEIAQLLHMQFPPHNDAVDVADVVPLKPTRAKR